MNSSGSGDASGATYNGSAAKTISHNTIGAVPYTGATGAVNLGANTLASGAITVNSSSGIINSTNQGTAASYLSLANTGGTTYIGRENSTGSGFGATAYSTILNSAGAYPLEFWVNGAKQMYLPSTGGLVVGTTINSGSITSSGSIFGTDFRQQGAGFLTFDANNAGTGTFVIRGGLNGAALSFAANNAATFSSTINSGAITSSGSISAVSTGLFNFGPTSYLLGMSGNSSSGVLSLYANNSQVLGFAATTGAATFSSTVTATSGGFDSDLTLKNVITRNLVSCYVADKISPIKYTWKDESKGTAERYGYGAQDLLELIPESVYKNGETYAVDYVQVHTLLLDECIKRIQTLEKRIESLTKHSII